MTGDRLDRPVPLVEVLDRAIDRGAVVTADALLGVADVDLIRVALRLAIVPADRAGRGRTYADAGVDPPRPAVASGPPPTAPGERVSAEPVPPAPAAVAAALPDVDRGGAERGLAQLVLTVVELLRELMDRQAVRRAVRGTLTDDEAERLGAALLALDERMDVLAEAFGLRRDELNLNLGPLGDLL